MTHSHKTWYQNLINLFVLKFFHHKRKCTASEEICSGSPVRAILDKLTYPNQVW